ncbi:hypothetical protein CLOSBL3_10457 [Clostridiaceae bacterium BL-3]|nr:hypothetical protein CLOSBL3_10457 [Clostridiaceae bacterium BL-3]
MLNSMRIFGEYENPPKFIFELWTLIIGYRWIIILDFVIIFILIHNNHLIYAC